MQNANFLNGNKQLPQFTMPSLNVTFPKQALIGLILVVALLAFELFNFDSTRYALNNLLGSVNFLGISWAAILAVAFCAIDFAGLARLFTPQRGAEEPREVWYLTGAWLLGATMNAIMTWWAVSLTLLNHDFGNEVLSRQQLLEYVPIFVAVLVWLTRILFIGAFSVAGDHFWGQDDVAKSHPAGRQPQPARQPARPAPSAPQPVLAREAAPRPGNGSSRMQQRPPQPGVRPVAPMNASARPRR
jgi:hypothetical protein